MKSDHVIITGGAGFLGSHLAERLLDYGHKVTVVDNLSTGRYANIRHLESNPHFRFYMHDIVKGFPFVLVDKADRIYHLASPASPHDYLRDLAIETMEVGAFGTYHVLDFAERTGARVLLASTSEVYGDPTVHPQPESYWGNVNPIGPRSTYDEAKRFAEALCVAFARHRNVSLRIARIFNTYGPRMRPNDGRVVSSFIMAALQDQPLLIQGGGHQTRSFCFVDDLVDGLIALMESDVREPVNLGNDIEFTVRELARVVCLLTNSNSTLTATLPLPEDDPKKRRPDLFLARGRLGYAPRVRLEEGLRKTIAYFQAQLTPTKAVA